MTTNYVKKQLPVTSIILYYSKYNIIDKVGKDTYDIRRIDGSNDPHKTIGQFDTEIRTIPNQEKIKKFIEFWDKYNKQTRYLNKYKHQKFGELNFHQIIKLYELECGITIKHLNDITFKLKKTLDPTLEIRWLFSNPFNFIREEKQLISYLTADKICKKLNIEISFDVKCTKWVFYHIVHKYNAFYAEKYKFYDDFEKLCKDNDKKYTDYLKIIKLVIIEKQIDGKNYVTTDYLYNCEKKIGEDFIDLYYDEKIDINPEIINVCIDKFEKCETEQNNKKYTIDIEQRNAIINAITNKLSIITGFPGTGKSSIVKCILFTINLINNNDIINTQKYVNSNVSIMCPTGLAYINIKKKCSINGIQLFNGDISGTCHKTLYNTFYKIIKKNKIQNTSPFDELDFSGDVLTDDETDLTMPTYAVVDEFSMMDMFMFKDLIKYCKIFNLQLILVGDNNQLPSIGPGCILNSIIDINKKYDIFNITYLSKIKRQDSGALLQNIIQLAKSGITIDNFIDDSMQFIHIQQMLDDNNIIIPNVFFEFIKKNELNETNSKFLTYFNGENAASKSHPTNVNVLNQLLQKKFNGDGLTIGNQNQNQTRFKVNDIIVRIENDNSGKVFRANGEQAKIIGYDNTKERFEIKYLDSEDSQSIDRDKFHYEFKLAYGLTVHKSQGSQYENVIIFIEMNSYVWDKPALYTAISRAENKCFIISDYSEFLKVQKNIKNSKKTTLFLKELESTYDFN